MSDHQPDTNPADNSQRPERQAILERWNALLEELQRQADQGNPFWRQSPLVNGMLFYNQGYIVIAHGRVGFSFVPNPEKVNWDVEISDQRLADLADSVEDAL